MSKPSSVSEDGWTTDEPRRGGAYYVRLKHPELAKRSNTGMPLLVRVQPYMREPPFCPYRRRPLLPGNEFTLITGFELPGKPKGVTSCRLDEILDECEWLGPLMIRCGDHTRESY